MNPKKLLLVLVLFGAGVYALGFLGLPQLLEARATRAWPKTEGEVLEARAEETHTRSGGSSHWLAVRYSYVVGENSYTGDRYIVSGNLRTSFGDALRRSEELPGTRVPVFYDPEDPAQAVRQSRPIDKIGKNPSADQNAERIAPRGTFGGGC